MWDQVKTENPDKKIWEIGRIIGQMWRELPEDVRNEYCEEYEQEKVEFWLFSVRQISVELRDCFTIVVFSSSVGIREENENIRELSRVHSVLGHENQRKNEGL